MIRNALRNAGRRLMRHELMGTDAAGNHYLRELTKNEEGVEVERRWVEPDPKKGYHYYDANEIAPEWHQWLTSRRDAPPDAATVLKAEAERNAIRQRAAALEDADVGQRLRAHAYGVQSQTATYPHELPEPERSSQETADASEQAGPEPPPPSPVPEPPQPHADEGVGSWVPPHRT